jgi:hypothetical protein
MEDANSKSLGNRHPFSPLDVQRSDRGGIERRRNKSLGKDLRGIMNSISAESMQQPDGSVNPDPLSADVVTRSVCNGRLDNQID